MRRGVVAISLSSALLAAVAACSSTPGPAGTAPQPAPVVTQPDPPVAAAAAAPTGIDVTGMWTGTVMYQGDEVVLDISLQRAADGRYTGQAQPRGEDSAPLSSLHLDGNHLVMVFAGPDGPAHFDMTLTADREAFTGTISYQNQQISFTARRRR